MSFLPLCKLQKKDHARIVRGALPVEVQRRLALQAKAEAEAIAKSAADHARHVEEMAAEYKRTLGDRMKAEQAKRFLANAEKFS